MKNSTNHASLLLVTTMAFLCATVLAVTRNVAARTSQYEWLFSKQATLISCTKNFTGDAGASDKNNGSGCAHQLGASCFLTISGDKRHKPRTC